MFIPKDSKLAGFKYVEVAKWVPEISRIVRNNDHKTRIPIMKTWDEVPEYAKKSGETGIYTSVFRYPQDSIEDETPRLGSLFFDFDSEDITYAQRDALKLHNLLEGILEDDKDIRLYFTGSKGFHIEVEALTLGISPSSDLDKLYKSIAEKLQKGYGLGTLDTVVYDPRRMWRLPYSKHQHTGLYKNPIPKRALEGDPDRIRKYCEVVRPYEVPKPTFNLVGNMWVQEMKELFKQDLERELEEMREKRKNLFLKHGSALSKGFPDHYIKQCWEETFEALANAEKGTRNETLNKESFRFFVVLLRSSKKTDKVFDKLVEAGIDMGLSKHESIRTVQSAFDAAMEKKDSNLEE